MGLDVTAYCGLKRVKNPSFDQYGEPKIRGNATRLYPNVDYPERAADVPGGVYRYDSSDGLDCGAYSSYNGWREELAKMAGWPEGSYKKHGQDWPSHAASAWSATAGPFWELINFSDCEGTLGTAVCKKLAADFAKHQHRVPTGSGIDSFSARYAKWRALFELASDSGAIEFH